MINYPRNKKRLKKRIFLLSIMGIACFISISVIMSRQTTHAQDIPVRRVNAPHFVGNVPSEQSAIFWFGEVYNNINHANVRVGYNDDELKLTFHIIDRRLFYDQTPTVSELSDWDAATLFLHLEEDDGDVITINTYRFVGQLAAWQSRDDYQVAYQGNSTNWNSISIPFTTTSGWRGDSPLNNIDDKGWWVKFQIPFSSLGLSEPPPTGSTWKMGLVIHDRDDAAGSSIPDQTWPESFDKQRPTTWGELSFGQASYNHLPSVPGGMTTVRHGLNGAIVKDAHVGGHGNCGDGLDHWSEWGEANYAGYDQINIQNQWDISDYPCFSKYYVTFPLDSLPPGKTIISSSLKMSLFGNAGYRPDQAQPSLVQVFSISDSWDEMTINWNNAPLASENIGATWVYPVAMVNPGPNQWNVSGAVANAYANNEPLRLALYSADGEYHSGKYFWSSDVGDWNATNRPTLEIVWGDSCSLSTVDCHFTYLPILTK